MREKYHKLFSVFLAYKSFEKLFCIVILGISIKLEEFYFNVLNLTNGFKVVPRGAILFQNIVCIRSGG